jgi:hypothetical protein
MSTIKSFSSACAQAEKEHKEHGCVRHVNAVIHEVRDDETREVVGHKIGGYWISDWRDDTTVRSY